MSVLNTCRVYVVGDRGVGKTTLIRRFMENNTEVGNKAVSCQLSAVSTHRVFSKPHILPGF